MTGSPLQPSRPARPAEALRLASELVGSQAAMARLLGVSQPTVWLWLRKDKPLPAKHVLTVEAATGISRHDLRPDIYPVETSASAPSTRDLGAMEPAR